jgi:hypothetical protein
MSPPARRIAPWLGLAALGAIALWVFAPYRERPFDIIDFSEILAILSNGSSAGGRLMGLVTYYGDVHGRFNVLSYAGMVAKWQLYGADPLAWQLVRAAQMLIAMVLTYLLLRRLAAGAWGAVIGSALVLFAFSATHAWVRLTVPEPLGLIFALCAALLGVRMRGSPHWRALAIGSGAMMLLAILAKEMLIAWVPVVAYLGCFLREDGELEAMHKPDAHARWLLSSLAAGTLIAALPVLRAMRAMKAHGYASQFGSGGYSMDRVLDIAQRMALPWPAGVGGDGAMMMLPALLFLVVIILGAVAARGDGAWWPHARRAMVLALAIPLMGTVLYSPWPVYWPSYGVPFLVGPALLLAIAVKSAERSSVRAGNVARGVALVCVLLVIAPSAHLANRMAARQTVDAELARALLDYPNTDSVVVALVVPPRAATVGIGPAMRAYALIIRPGATVPAVIDAQCADALARGKRPGGLGRTVVISYTDQCGPITGATFSSQRAFGYFDLDHLTTARDSIRADLFDPMTHPVK